MSEELKEHFKKKYSDVDLKPLYDSVELLVNHDEIDRAILLLNNFPAYFRENPTEKMLELKNEIQSRTATPYWYATCDHYIDSSPEGAKWALENNVRGYLIENNVKEYNEKGITPHIVDLGPGTGWMPIGLKAKNYKFTYQPLIIAKWGEHYIKERLGDVMVEKPPQTDNVIFVACEIIEHLSDPTDIRKEFLRYGCNAEIIHLSTPLYAFDFHAPWRTKDLGHLRAYTTREFQEIIFEMFPEYEFKYIPHEVQSLIGLRKK